MSQVMIINHGGSTSLLSEPLTEGKKTFPFVFYAVTPEERRWAYRLLPSDPAHPKDEQLIQLLQGPRATLRADWEEQVGHPVGFITIYLPPKGGQSGKREARFDQGPELGPDLRPLTPQVPPPPPPPEKNTGPLPDPSDW
jgi:hypothetical protein